jgi:hypothetical protein
MILPKKQEKAKTAFPGGFLAIYPKKSLLFLLINLVRADVVINNFIPPDKSEKDTVLIIHRV